MAAILERIPHWRVGSVDLTAITRETAEEVADNDLQGLAAEMAHHSVLAIFPFLLFLAGLTAVVDNIFGIDNLSDRIVDEGAEVLPADATSLLRSFVEEVVHSDGSGASVFGLAAALWAGSGAIGSAMKGLNRICDAKEERGIIRRKLTAIALTVVFSGSLLVAVVLMAGAPLVASAVGDAFGWESGARSLVRWLLWPASIVLIALAVSLLYWIAPCRKLPFRWVTPGTILFTIGWVSASVIFSFYISNFGSYNRTYGSLAAVIILLVWLYWSNLLLLIGAQLNFVLERHESGESRREEAAQAQP